MGGGAVYEQYEKGILIETAYKIKVQKRCRKTVRVRSDEAKKKRRKLRK